MQRTWLWGLDGGRPALLLDFAPPGAPLEPRPPAGSAITAELAFYPGATPLRALVAGDPGPLEPAPGSFGSGGAAAALDAVAGAVAANPWLEEWPVALAEAVPDGRDGGAVDGGHGRRSARARRLRAGPLAAARRLRRSPRVAVRAVERRGADAARRRRRHSDGGAVTTVRRARPEDAGGIARVWIAAWRIAYRGLVPDALLDGLSVDERRAHWRARLEAGDTTFVAAEHGIAGYCRVVHAPVTPTPARTSARSRASTSCPTAGAAGSGARC